MDFALKTDTSILLDKIIAYEAGLLDWEQTVALFQELISTGLVWTLQGHYGRTANRLLAEGLCEAA